MTLKTDLVHVNFAKALVNDYHQKLLYKLAAYGTAGAYSLGLRIHPGKYIGVKISTEYCRKAFLAR